MNHATARREVAAARQAGWYVNHWGQKYVPPGVTHEPKNELRRTPDRIAVMQAIASGQDTLNTLAAALPHKTRAQVENIVRRFGYAAPWVWTKELTHQGGENRYRLTERGAALLAEWRAQE
jgi:hypothetical protein